MPAGVDVYSPVFGGPIMSGWGGFVTFASLPDEVETGYSQVYSRIDVAQWRVVEEPVTEENWYSGSWGSEQNRVLGVRWRAFLKLWWTAHMASNFGADKVNRELYVGDEARSRLMNTVRGFPTANFPGPGWGQPVSLWLYAGDVLSWSAICKDALLDEDILTLDKIGRYEAPMCVPTWFDTTCSSEGDDIVTQDIIVKGTSRLWYLGDDVAKKADYDNYVKWLRNKKGWITQQSPADQKDPPDVY